MALALLFAFVVIGAGFATLRVLGIGKGALGLGLAPAAGLAVLSIEATWCTLLNVPPPVAGIVLVCVSALGLGLAVMDRHALGLAARTLKGEQRLAAIVLVAALAVTAVSTGITFAGSPVPLSPHDGAYHAQVIEAHRTGQVWVDWYPQGMAALFAAMMQLLPWVDSAQGAMDLGLALPLLAVVAVFGLAVSLWHDLLIASAAALLLSLTYIYPYFPQLWSGWPLAIALILVMGQWTIGLEYLSHASWRWALLSGLIIASMVLVHGTELLTVAIILLVLLGSVRGHLDWPALVRHVGLAAGVALLCAAPYLPTLLHWAGTGGAYAVGIEDGQLPIGDASVPVNDAPPLFAVFALQALGVDLPIRLVLLTLGALWAFRTRTGRAVVIVGLLFTGITATFTFLSSTIPVVRQAYASTFPWGMHYRIFMVVAIAQVLLAGAGLVVGMRSLETHTTGPTAWTRRARRTSRLLGVTWFGLMTWGLTIYLAFPTGKVLGYTADDAAAMGWLRQHAARGEVLANDGFADAGIWAPYKAGLEVLMPRVGRSDDSAMRGVVLGNIARLDQTPEAGAAACALNVAYVYHGAHASEWDARGFPPLADLRASPALEEVFSSGEAVVFRTRLGCPQP